MALISVSSTLLTPQPGTSLHCETTDRPTWLVRRVVCLLTSRFTQLLIAPTHGGTGGQAELSWVAGYIPRWFTRLQPVTHPGTNRARRRATTCTLTEIKALAISQETNKQTLQNAQITENCHSGATRTTEPKGLTMMSPSGFQIVWSWPLISRSLKYLIAKYHRQIAICTIVVKNVFYVFYFSVKHVFNVFFLQILCIFMYFKNIYNTDLVQRTKG